MKKLTNLEEFINENKKNTIELMDKIKLIRTGSNISIEKGDYGKDGIIEINVEFVDELIDALNELKK